MKKGELVNRDRDGNVDRHSVTRATASTMQRTVESSSPDVGHRGPDKQPGIDSWLATAPNAHPSRKLELRSHGYGIASGYEKPYVRDKTGSAKLEAEQYGPIPHSGYYGAGETLRPFKIGQGGFRQELEWYQNQYGSKTSGFEESKGQSKKR